MAEDRFTLFGMQSPEDVRRSIGRTATSDALNFASLPKGRAGVAVANILPKVLGKALGIDTQEDKMAQARTDSMKNAFDRSKGKPTDYYKFLAQNLNSVGDTQGSMQALEKYRSIQAAQAAGEFKARELDIKEKKGSELFLVRSEANRIKEEQIETSAELDRANTEIKRLLADSTTDLNSQKVKNLQAKVIEMDDKLAQSAERLRQADDRIVIERDRAATLQFDATTRRMKLKTDEKLAKLKATGISNKADEKRMNIVFNDFSKIVQKKSYDKFLADVIESSDEFGGFFSNVDPDVLSTLTRNAVQQKISEARVNKNVDFNLNEATEQAIREVAATFVSEQPGVIGGTNPEVGFPREVKKETDEEMMQRLLSGG